MDFCQALEAIKAGYRCARSGWNGKGMYVALWTPGPHDDMTRPFLYIKDAQGHRVPWLCAQHDLLGEDWEVLS